MNLTLDDVAEYRNHILKPTDTFQFECRMCGNCCRKRKDPITITGFDIFRIAQALETTTKDVLLTKTQGVLGSNSHLPVAVLKERLDGSCCLLRNGRCMVHSNKPIVCAVHPLGRMVNLESNEIQYFTQSGDCCESTGGGRIWTLQEWLDEFHIADSDKEIMAWSKLVNIAAMALYKIPTNKISDEMMSLLLHTMYINYGTSRTYLEQAEANVGLLKGELKQKFHIIVKLPGEVT